MKKAGLWSTISSTLGTVETIAGEVTRSVTILSSYNSNWQEEREIATAEARRERAIRWAKLGAEIRTQEINTEDVQLAMNAYKTKGE